MKKLRDFYNGKTQDQLLNTLKLYREGLIRRCAWRRTLISRW